MRAWHPLASITLACVFLATSTPMTTSPSPRSSLLPSPSLCVWLWVTASVSFAHHMIPMLEVDALCVRPVRFTIPKPWVIAVRRSHQCLNLEHAIAITLIDALICNASECKGAFQRKATSTKELATGCCRTRDCIPSRSPCRARYRAK